MEILQCLLAVAVYAAVCGGLFLVIHGIRAHALGWVTARCQWAGWGSAGTWLGWRLAGVLLSVVSIVALFAPLYLPILVAGWAFPVARPILIGVWVITVPGILLKAGGGRVDRDGD